MTSYCLFEVIGDIGTSIILSLCDESALLNMAATSRWLNALSRANLIWRHKCVEMFNIVQRELVTIDVVLSIVKQKNYVTRNTYERFNFLNCTCKLLKNYVDIQSDDRVMTWGNTTSYWVLYSLLRNIGKQLRETSTMLTDLNNGLFQITVNFDIFDLTLRKYFNELMNMIPVDIPSDDSFECIAVPKPLTAPESSEDRIHMVLGENASFWISVLGNNTVVPYDIFVNNLLPRIDPLFRENKKALMYMNHLFNFPRDNFFSVYRFKVVVSLFGPLPQVYENFCEYTLAPGFIGCINSIKSEELLTELIPQLRRSTVLIRFSRKRPEVLAFTSINVRTGEIEHRRNVNKRGEPIPIAKYLEMAFPRYELIRMGIDEVATHIDTTIEFAKFNRPNLYDGYPAHH